MAFIFAKTPDAQVASLATELEKLAKTKKLYVVINFTGAASDEYLAKIKAIGEKAPNVGLGITDRQEGENKFKVKPAAEVTVMHYAKKKVTFNAALAKGKLDKEAIAKIVKGAKDLLK